MQNSLLGLLAIASVATAMLQPVGGFPPVLLSDEHREQIVIDVGQPLPDLELPLVGTDQLVPLPGAYGESGSVIVWIAALDRQAKALVRDLTPDVIDRYAKRNIGLVVVAVGKRVDLKAIRELGYEGSVYHDADGTSFKAIGSISLPRVYVLDQQGQIAWFDIEYSQTTRRELSRSLRLLAPAE